MRANTGKIKLILGEHHTEWGKGRNTIVDGKIKLGSNNPNLAISI